MTFRSSESLSFGCAETQLHKDGRPCNLGRGGGGRGDAIEIRTRRYIFSCRTIIGATSGVIDKQLSVVALIRRVRSPLGGNFTVCQQLAVDLPAFPWRDVGGSCFQVPGDVAISKAIIESIIPLTLALFFSRRSFKEPRRMETRAPRFLLFIFLSVCTFRDLFNFGEA